MRRLSVLFLVNSADFLSWLESSAPVVFPPAYRRRPLIMGILNITPDSFSDGGCFLDLDNAFCQAEKMVAEGADLLDIGGESSKPGALSVTSEQELARVMPVIVGLRARYDIALSIDTCKPEVMQAAVTAGVSLINDITALQTPGALETAARLNTAVCLMHMQGSPASMQVKPYYEPGVVSAIDTFFAERIEACLTAGILRRHLMLDPGFGFGKTDEQNLLLTQQLSLFQSHQLPVLLGCSRKSTLGNILKQPVTNRLPGGLGLAVFAALQGVSMIRTHDVGATQQALHLVDAVVTIADEGEHKG